MKNDPNQMLLDFSTPAATSDESPPADDPTPVDVEAHADLAIEIARRIDRVHDSIHDAGAFRRSLEVWWALLDRHMPGGEARYLEAIKGMPPKALQALSEGFALLVLHFCFHGRYCDVLGRVYMDIASKWGRQSLGQFFTPWAVAVAMAEIGLHDCGAPTNAEGHPLSISDPCVGGGVMLLAARGIAAKRWGRLAASRLRLFGQDIDPVCVLMARIQIRLTDDCFMWSFLTLWRADVLAAASEAA